MISKLIRQFVRKIILGEDTKSGKRPFISQKDLLDISRLSRAFFRIRSPEIEGCCFHRRCRRSGMVRTTVARGGVLVEIVTRFLDSDVESIGMKEIFSPVTITGKNVALEPLGKRHLSDLEKAGAVEAIWRWLPTPHHLPGSMSAFIESAEQAFANRAAVPFATIDLNKKRAVGSTRYHHIALEHRRLEIGVTWLGIDSQRSFVNTEAKLLQLWHAFERLNCRRVELKADVENMKSRAAILRLGAIEEGIFRKHMLYQDGRNRDNVYFSIIDDDWPSVRAALEERLGYSVSPALAE